MTSCVAIICMYALISIGRSPVRKTRLFTLFHRVSSSHVKLLSSYLPLSYPSFVVPAFEELPFYIGWELISNTKDTEQKQSSRGVL